MSGSDSDSEGEEGLGLDSMFPEPPRPPTPESKLAVYTREKSPEESDNDWKEISLRLVGSHSLWGHYLWNAALALATFLDSDEKRSLYRNKQVLELGAGGALPSIVAAKNGASKVVITDYPDEALVENIRHNVVRNLSEEERGAVAVEGYIWGRPTETLISHCRPSHPYFDLVILSDLIFNHSQHAAMLSTCEDVLAPRKAGQEGKEDPCVLVFFTHHRPQFAKRDMGFFDLATERGWTCEDAFTRKFPPMFAEDPGDEEVRSTVHGYVLRRL